MSTAPKALPDQAAGDDFVAKLRAALPPLLDELLGLEPEPDPARRPATPPQPETKPWRQRFWGGD